MQKESFRARAAIDVAMNIILAQGMGGSEALRHLQSTREALEHIKEALCRFKNGPP